MPSERIQIIVDAIDNTKKGIQSAAKGMEGLRDGINKHSTEIATAIGGATAAVVAFGKSSIESYSNLNESINAVQVIFGEGAQKVLAFGQASAQSVGLATAQYNQLASVTGALLKDVGLPMDEVANKTTELTVRAADMASVMNTDVQDALSAINQALRGETEAIRRYAGDVTDATLQQYALSQGITTSTTEMTEQEKRTLRVGLVMQQTNKFAGDFSNTQSGLANQMRIANAEFENAKAILGQQLAPILSEVIIPLIRDVAIPAVRSFASGFEAVTDSIAYVLIQIDKLNAKIKSVRENGGVTGKALDLFFGKEFATGGIVEGIGKVPVVAHGGEMILNQEQQQRMFSLLDSPRNISVNLGGVNINNTADSAEFFRKLNGMLGGGVESSLMGVS